MLIVWSVLWLAHQQIDNVLIVDGNLRHAVDPEEEFGAADAVSGDLPIRVRDLDLAQLNEGVQLFLLELGPVSAGHYFFG